MRKREFGEILFIVRRGYTKNAFTAAIFIPVQVEVAAVLWFLGNGIKLYFYSLGTIFQPIRRSQNINLWTADQHAACGRNPVGGFLLDLFYARD